jgi:hypothetical protein
MILLLILILPVVAFEVARWAWRLQLRALDVLGPGLALSAGVSVSARTARLASVMVLDDTLLVGLRSDDELATVALEGADRTCLDRLEHWRVSDASVLVWTDPVAEEVELWQLHTGQCVRLAMAGRTTADIPAVD